MSGSDLQSQVQAWWNDQHQHGLTTDPEHCQWGSCDWWAGRSWDQLVASLRPYLSRKAARAAQELNEPGVRTALSVAQFLLPAPYGEEVKLVEALIEAASAQTVEARDRALIGVGVALLMIVALYIAAQSSGPPAPSRVPWGRR